MSINLSSYNADGSTTNSFPDFRFGTLYTWVTPRPVSPPPIYITNNYSTVTGTSPQETQYALYGHPVPLSVFGKGRIGFDIISGPVVENGLASFIVSAGVPADPSGTRILLDIAFDSEIVWEGTLTGAGTPSSSGFKTEPFTVRFYDGKLTQAADAIEVARYGADAVGYIPQILLAIENLPLANTKFKKVPYISALLSDTSGEDVNWGEALERIAYSPYVGLTSDEFESVNIADGVTSGGIIISAENTDFLGLLRQFGKFYPTWDILQTDKLRLSDRGSIVAPDLVLDTSNLMGNLTVARVGADAIKKDLELSTIDPDSDYTIVPFLAEIPRYPVAATTSVGKDSDFLPAIMDASTRGAVTTLARYYQEQARKSVSGRAMIAALEMEPGDLIVCTDVGNEVFRVAETLHGIDNSVEFSAASILNCKTVDPYWNYVVLLVGFEGSDGDTGAPGFTDESPRAHGTAFLTDPTKTYISRDQYRFGHSSARCDTRGPLWGGSSDWRLSAANSDQFTIELSVYFNNLDTNQLLIGQWHALHTSVGWAVLTSTSGEFLFAYSTTGGDFDVVVASTGAGLVEGEWTNIVVDKNSSGKIRLYKDGVMVGSDTPANSAFFNSSNSITIGMTEFIGALSDCWIDEVRVTKGIARYASDSGFSVPTGAFPRSG
jgi:hypothetical protein